MIFEPGQLKIVFMGTSAFAVPSLEEMIRSHYNLLAVVSQPDRPRGRGKQVQPTPVKETALQHDCVIYQFPRIKQADAIETLAVLHPDLLVVVSYGQILPVQLLEVPRLGSINLHASLLPRYRGAAPVQRAIMAGENKTGITTMLMDAGMDTGDILLQEEVDIAPEMDHGQLEEVLADQGSLLLKATIEKLARGELCGKKQDEGQASYAPMIGREDEIIDWSGPARVIYDHIRGLSPVPGAYTAIDESRLKIYRSRVYSDIGQGRCGEILNYTPEGFLVQTGKGCLEVLEVQKEGKKRMTARDFIKGFHLPQGSLLHI